ncbi:MAG: glutamine-hydrolyzing GMP synthase [Treponema sp.]|nr:glutamine-hydrolyzing GMP synthase [Treponema sp.]
MKNEKIVVLDFGSQYAHLIAKRFRFLGYYSEISLPSVSVDELVGAKGIVLSGGPASVYEKDVPDFNEEILKLNIPILGLCYGHQLMAHLYGARVQKSSVGEFGKATLQIGSDGASEKYSECALFKNVPDATQVWMSHQDEVVTLAEGFEIVASTKDCKIAATQNKNAKRYSFQFHAEVVDTPLGNVMFENFAALCGLQKNWSTKDVLEKIISDIKKDARNKKVLLFLSGGVDSTVTFALLNKSLKKEQVLGLHIDNGFMRKNESASIAKAYREAGFDNFIVEDASEQFLLAVKGECDPQKKRGAIGDTFVKVRDAIVERLHLNEEDVLLAQGTLYPDIIESGGTKNSNVIKTHHNRVEAIQSLIERGLVLEPLKNLYKDEVRFLGKELGLDASLVMRHPFPGPGLSINTLCSTGVLSSDDEKEFLQAQKECESFSDTISKMLNCENDANEMCSFVLPVKSVGVQGDFRTYRFPCVLAFSCAKGVSSFCFDGKQSFDWEQLENLSSTITNGARFINRVIVQLYKKSNVTLSLQESYCTKERLDKLREIDAIVLEVLHKTNWYEKIFQHLTISLPYASCKENGSFVLRPVTSEDVMTARFSKLPKEIVLELTQRISALPFVDALYFDITNKPPATFGWE